MSQASVSSSGRRRRGPRPAGQQRGQRRVERVRRRRRRTAAPAGAAAGPPPGRPRHAPSVRPARAAAGGRTMFRSCYVGFRCVVWVGRAGGPLIGRRTGRRRQAGRRVVDGAGGPAGGPGPRQDGRIGRSGAGGRSSVEDVSSPALTDAAPHRRSTAPAVAAACRVMDDAGGPVPADDLAAAARCSARQLHRAFAAVLAVTPLQYGRAVRTGRAREVLRAGRQRHRRRLGGRLRLGPRLLRGGRAPARDEPGRVRRRGPRAPPAVGRRAHRPRRGPRRRQPGRHLRGPHRPRRRPGRPAAVEAGLLAEVRAELPHAELVRDRAGPGPRHGGRPGPGPRRGGRRRPAARRGRDGVPGAGVAGAAAHPRRARPAPTPRSPPRSARPPRSGPWPGPAPPTRSALVVPCHRVVRSDGALAGYRWGLAVKRRWSRPSSAARRVPTLSR